MIGSSHVQRRPTERVTRNDRKGYYYDTAESLQSQRYAVLGRHRFSQRLFFYPFCWVQVSHKLPAVNRFLSTHLNHNYLAVRNPTLNTISHHGNQRRIRALPRIQSQLMVPTYLAIHPIRLPGHFHRSLRLPARQNRPARSH